MKYREFILEKYKAITQPITIKAFIWSLLIGALLMFVQPWGIQIASFIILLMILAVVQKQYKYISLIKAATLLIDKTPSLTNKVRGYVRPFNQRDMSDAYYKQRERRWEAQRNGAENLNTIHEETLPERTINAINLCLRVCKKNNTKIYGKFPLFSAYSTYATIPFEKIQYFDASYTKLYSAIDRDSTKLIYDDVCVLRRDFKRAIKNLV